MKEAEPPRRVLSEALREAVDGRQVRAAVFTTYSFDPEFFETEVLPLLFSDELGASPSVRRARLEGELEKVEELAVYYDARALLTTPALLDFRRYALRQRDGVFHPKVAMLLIDHPMEEEDRKWLEQRLVVFVMSANLTRSGWWYNVEVAHSEEVETEDGRRDLRRGILHLIRRLRRVAGWDTDHRALDLVRRFVAADSRRGGGSRFPRLYCGPEPLASWLRGNGIKPGEWNLDVISPYMDADPSGALKHFYEELAPRQVRIMLPEKDGLPSISRETYDKVRKMVGDTINWAELPESVVERRGARRAGAAPKRFVHAKVYRFWRRGEERLLVGSPNLTRAAHAVDSAGNFEAALLVEGAGGDESWLRATSSRPSGDTTQPQEEEEQIQVELLPLALRYDWDREVLEYRIESEKVECQPIVLSRIAGGEICRIADPRAGGRWTACAGKAEVGDLFLSTSLVHARCGDHEWTVLVREEQMHRKPSRVKQLTPSEILEYWSLLSPEQREDFIVRRLLESIPAAEREGVDGDYEPAAAETIFDRFAGVFHAFGQLSRNLADASRQGLTRNLAAKLTGRKFDSLPEFLASARREKNDPVMFYLELLCALQVYRQAESEMADVRGYESLLRRVRRAEGDLQREVDEAGRVIAPSLGESGQEFLKWYKRMFLEPARTPEKDEA